MANRKIFKYGMSCHFVKDIIELMTFVLLALSHSSYEIVYV